MSVATWKEEYYPKPADSVTTEEEAIDHSLRKWIGLRYENLARHQVGGNLAERRLVDKVEEYAGSRITDRSMMIDCDTCALCVMFHDEDAYEESDYGIGASCAQCPLAIARGRACDVQTDEEEENLNDSPWFQFINYADPEPMIIWLEKTREEVKAKQQEEIAQ